MKLFCSDFEFDQRLIAVASWMFLHGQTRKKQHKNISNRLNLSMFHQPQISFVGISQTPCEPFSPLPAVDSAAERNRWHQKKITQSSFYTLRSWGKNNNYLQLIHQQLLRVVSLFLRQLQDVLNANDLRHLFVHLLPQVFDVLVHLLQSRADISHFSVHPIPVKNWLDFLFMRNCIFIVDHNQTMCHSSISSDITCSSSVFCRSSSCCLCWVFFLCSNFLFTSLVDETNWAFDFFKWGEIYWQSNITSDVYRLFFQNYQCMYCWFNGKNDQL